MGAYLNAAVIIVAVIAVLGVLRLSRRWLPVDRSKPQVQILGIYSPVLTWLKNQQLAWQPKAAISTNGVWAEGLGRLKSAVLHPQSIVVEWILIAAWGLWLGQKYLDTNPFIWPAGYALGIKLIGHQFWIDLQQCGLCALWNGSSNGGHPAFADLFGSQFHPLIAVTTLIWGVIVGTKFSLVGIMILAGLGQWWIARLLGLGRVARVWSSLLAQAGGHLATTQFEGNLGLSLSLASAALVVAAAISLSQAPNRRKTVILAITGAPLVLSGQGFIQVGLLAWAPAVLFLLLNKNREQAAHLVRELVIAVGLSVLLTAFLLIPTAHFWPNFTKDAAADPTFAFAQPLEYIPLNYFIRDSTYFITGGILGKPANADLPFLGWVPILLAWLSLRFARGRDVPVLGFLATGAFISMWLGSAIPLRWLSTWSPYFLWVKYLWVFAGMAVPAILGIAAFGLDKLMQLQWPRVHLAMDTDRAAELKINTQWLMVLPLRSSLYLASQFAGRFITTQDQTKLYAQNIGHYHTASTEWVSPPFAEPAWTEPALDSGLKVTYQEFSGSKWAGRDLPPPYLISVRGDLVSSKPFEQVDAIEQLPVYRIPANEYAFVTYADGTTAPCKANAKGGFITVICVLDRDGILTVTENVWSSWNAWLDGKPVAVLTREDQNVRWLGATAPAGQHTFEFKFLPWDVWIGLSVSLIGAGLLIYYWFAGRQKTLPTASEGRSFA